MSAKFRLGSFVRDANGQVTFYPIVPGWATGRMLQIRVEVPLKNDTSMPTPATTQIAFPQTVTQAVIAGAATP